jgi:hypothetical protein
MEQVIIFGLIVLYKIIGILAGLAFAYMGYRLFLEDKIKTAGTIETGGNGYKLKVTNAAPGIFFSLFGTVVIVFSVMKNISYSHVATSDESAPETKSRVIPDKPPF